jgi:hypothetical protein
LFCCSTQRSNVGANGSLHSKARLARKKLNLI